MRIIYCLLCYCSLSTMVRAQSRVEQWDRAEIAFHHKTAGNPFTTVQLKATFTGPGTTLTITGFYDGADTFRIRFMPPRQGNWQYKTSSNIPALNNRKGTLTCTAPTGQNHGPVQVAATHNFQYADSTPYYPFGTTAYAWTHMGQQLQEQTLNTLQQSGFNKIRMCVFPKNYQLVKEEPELYPFEIKESGKDENGNERKRWDFEQFNPAFFRHLEKRIDDLKKLGIEADLILFHPYDKGRWGFDEMDRATNTRYIQYLLARLSSLRNVWWSLANEWDYVKAKTRADWDHIAGTVVAADPYRHLCSIHGATATYYDYWQSTFTHVSIQDETPVQSPGAAAMLRHIYHKPVIADEVGYEGNLPFRWGRYSPEEMTHLVINGLMGGIYVTHGESYMFKDATDTIFWAKGGTFKGTSWQNIAFLRNIIQQCPQPLQLADVGRDNQTATAGNGYFFVYFGKEMPGAWSFNLPAKNAGYERVKLGTRFQVEIIDPLNRHITPYPAIFETTAETDYRLFDKNFQKIYLPAKPYILLRIRALTNH